MSFLERKWETVNQSFTANGTTNGIVSVADATGFHVGQRATLRSDTIDSANFEVKRVIGPSTIHVGPMPNQLKASGEEGKETYSNISQFLLADNAEITIFEQEMPFKKPGEIGNAAFCRAPTNAWRSVLVDKYGVKIDSNNPLPVDAVLNFSGITADTPNIKRIPVAAAATEGSTAIPIGTKGFRVKIEDSKDIVRIAYTAGDIAAGKYIQVRRGSWYRPPADLNTSAGLTLYFETLKPTQILVVESWA